ncbi:MULTISPECIES: hypothetical protein [Sphingomonas]|uniref:hypothetical protein n=1 Tax=Sphingomonas TaxID=13687 RepID=UPI000DEFDAE1|nr:MULTISPECIES: hypothetical protein [Sphingomonas]
MKVTRILLGALLFTAAQSAFAAIIVVRAVGPSAGQYPVGKALPDSASLRLRGGDTVVLLDARGSRTLKGPGIFPAAATGSAGGVSSFSALMASANGRRGRVGAVRPAPQPRQLWQASSDHSETFCFTNPAGVLIRRESIADPRTISVTDLATGKTAPIRFAAAQQVVEWPSAVPLVSGNRYRIGSAEAAMKQIGAGTSFADLGSALVKNGCLAQLDALGTTTAYVSN